MNMTWMDYLIVKESIAIIKEFTEFNFFFQTFLSKDISQKIFLIQIPNKRPLLQFSKRLRR